MLPFWPSVCSPNFYEVVPLENSFITDSRAIPAANIILLLHERLERLQRSFRAEWCTLYQWLINVATVLDTDNLHFSNKFLDFPVQADADIQMDALGFSAQFRCNFPQDSAWKAGFVALRIRAESGESAGTYVRSYVQCLHVHSQHTSFINGIE